MNLTFLSNSKTLNEILTSGKLNRTYVDQFKTAGMASGSRLVLPVTWL